jgi:hypothetical protein
VPSASWGISSVPSAAAYATVMAYSAELGGGGLAGGDGGLGEHRTSALACTRATGKGGGVS